jgi:hypothetical protein
MRFLTTPCLALVTLVALAGATAVTSSAWASSQDAITADQTTSRMGECMTVEGQVNVRPAIGRFGADLSFQSNSGFVGYVPAVASLGDLSRYDGQTVDLTGVIEPGQYTLTQIQVTSPEQLIMADETPDRLVTCDHF